MLTTLTIQHLSQLNIEYNEEEDSNASPIYSGRPVPSRAISSYLWEEDDEEEDEEEEDEEEEEINNLEGPGGEK